MLGLICQLLVSERECRNKDNSRESVPAGVPGIKFSNTKRGRKRGWKGLYTEIERKADRPSLFGQHTDVIEPLGAGARLHHNLVSCGLPGFLLWLEISLLRFHDCESISKLNSVHEIEGVV